MFFRNLLFNKLFRIGLVIFLIGSTPLLVYFTAAKLGFVTDPNPNPVGLGMMAYFTFWPSIVIMTISGFIEFRASKEE